jgi:hypothetical protein
MTDEDLTQLNNIMISCSNGLITVAEKLQFDPYIFNTPKVYYDVCLAILTARQVSNTKLKSFYEYAKTQGYTYGEIVVNNDILWVGSAR